jgi:hypothetical protein
LRANIFARQYFKHYFKFDLKNNNWVKPSDGRTLFCRTKDHVSPTNHDRAVTY